MFYQPLQPPVAHRGIGCAGCGLGAASSSVTMPNRADVVDYDHAALRNGYWAKVLGWAGNVAASEAGGPRDSRTLAWAPGAGTKNPGSTTLIPYVMGYQIAHDLFVDGILGPKTYEKLSGKVAPRPPVVPDGSNGTPTPAELEAAYRGTGGTDWKKILLIAGGGGLVLIGLVMLSSKKGKGRKGKR